MNQSKTEGKRYVSYDEFYKEEYGHPLYNSAWNRFMKTEIGHIKEQFYGRKRSLAWVVNFQGYKSFHHHLRIRNKGHHVPSRVETEAMWVNLLQKYFHREDLPGIMRKEGLTAEEAKKKIQGILSKGCWAVWGSHRETGEQIDAYWTQQMALYPDLDISNLDPDQDTDHPGYYQQQRFSRATPPPGQKDNRSSYDTFSDYKQDLDDDQGPEAHAVSRKKISEPAISKTRSVTEWAFSVVGRSGGDDDDKMVTDDGGYRNGDDDSNCGDYDEDGDEDDRYSDVDDADAKDHDMDSDEGEVEHEEDDGECDGQVYRVAEDVDAMVLDD